MVGLGKIVVYLCTMLLAVNECYGRTTQGNPMYQAGETRSCSKKAKAPKPPKPAHFDFEPPASPPDEDSFETDASDGSSIEVSPDYAKSGSNSLKWDWPVDAVDDTTYTLVLNLNIPIVRKIQETGGFKFWMYRPKCLPKATMTITLATAGAPPGNYPLPKVATANIDWSKGWRAVWIHFKEFKFRDTKATSIQHITFSVQQPSAASESTREVAEECNAVSSGGSVALSENMLYFDLVEVVPHVAKKTRDQVVPYLPGSKKDTSRNSYQRTYYWSTFQDVIPSPDEYIDSTADIDALMEDLRKVERQINNWYADVETSTYDDLNHPQLKKIRKKKLQSLFVGVNKAHKLYEELVDGLGEDDDIKQPPLFTKVSEYGKDKIATGVKTKFSFITTKILQPIAIDYILKSRTRQIERTLDKECMHLNDPRKRGKVIERVAGKSDGMADLIPATVTNCNGAVNSLENAITNLNEERKKRIIRLLKYIHDQGFADGSGLGSFDHEWNKNGAGFMHGVYAVRKHLTGDFRDEMVRTAKYYNDFNEVYGKSNTFSAAGYEFDGTTSDQMKTMMYYRCMTVFLMPQATVEEKRLKIRDLFACRDNAENSMKVNLGLGGAFKPDGTTFHHQAFYGPAYAPHAIHTAAIVQFILDGTAFRLGDTAVNNLRRSLEVMRIVAVKYSTPNSIAGRFPDYKKHVLARILPAYAYISIKRDPVQDTVEGSRMFHRLFDPLDAAIEAELENGAAAKPAYYLNTIGSVDQIQWVLTKSETAAECPAFPVDQCKEASPNGHWNFNFAALSVQRRGDWAVAAKGFNKFVWDFESGGAKENTYGIFGSYGSLQISNSEEALASYDIDEGWDWTRIAGATTVNLNLEDLVLKKMRYYNKKTLAGGVGLCGSEGSASSSSVSSKCSKQNGVFAMDFDKPDYMPKRSASPLESMEFKFKKSFFFMENLIVCVTSDVQQTAPAHYAQTILFQDKRLDASTQIEIDGVAHVLNSKTTDFEETFPGHTDNVVLKDTRNNIYRVASSASRSGLKVKISDQASMKDDGCTPSTAKYATSWIEHQPSGTGTFPTIRYDILIAGGPLNEDRFKDAKLRQKNSDAHIVEFKNLPRPDTNTFGYSVFTIDTPLSYGPIAEVDHECTIMTEENDDAVFIALSNPGFKLVKDDAKDEKIPCKGSDASTFGGMDEQSDMTKELLYCSRSDSIDITVTLSASSSVKVASITKVWVNSKEIVGADDYVTLDTSSEPKKLVFKQLENGFTSEVKIAFTSTATP